MGRLKGRPRTISGPDDPPANGQPQLRVRVSREAAAWVQTQGGPSFLRGLILGVMTYVHPAAHTEQSSVMRSMSGTYPDLPDKRPSDVGVASLAPPNTPAPIGYQISEHSVAAPPFPLIRRIGRRRPPADPLPKGENNG